MTKLKLEKVMTSFQWRHYYYVTKLTSRDFFILSSPNQNFWQRQWSCLT